MKVKEVNPLKQGLKRVNKTDEEYILLLLKK